MQCHGGLAGQASSIQVSTHHSYKVDHLYFGDKEAQLVRCRTSNQ